MINSSPGWSFFRDKLDVAGYIYLHISPFTAQKLPQNMGIRILRLTHTVLFSHKMEALLSNNPHLYPPLLSIAPSIFFLQEVAGLVGAFRRFAHLCGNDFVRVAVGLGGHQQGHPPWVARCEKKEIMGNLDGNPIWKSWGKSLNECFL